MLNRLPLCMLLLFSYLLLNTGVAHAKVYKCVDASGSTTYSQVPCPVEEKTAKVIKTATRANNVDCRIANNFARHTALGMKSGLTADATFNQYGGLDALPRTAIGVINYVYTHKENPNVEAQRIVALSAARCSGGSYGDVACDDFPYGFISQAGGCDAAAKTLLQSGPSADKNQEQASNNAPVSQEQNMETDAIDTSALQEKLQGQDDCGSMTNKINALLTGSGKC